MRTGTKQTGQFKIQTGMAFVMPELANIHPNQDIKAEEHPWIITNIFEDYIEIVMASTLSSDAENKHQFRQLNYDDTTDILHPCPPMDDPKIRNSKVSLNTAILLPIKELFSNPIYILNTNNKNCNFTTHGLQSLCLQQPDLKYLQQELLKYQQQHPQSQNDPFNCEEQIGYLYDLQDGLPVPQGFTQQSYNKQFAWQHIKPANPYAVYPFEDQMYDYEKNDPNLLKIAKVKKQQYTKKPVKQTQNNTTLYVKLATKIQQQTHKQHPPKPKKKKQKMTRQQINTKINSLSNTTKASTSKKKHGLDGSK